MQPPTPSLATRELTLLSFLVRRTAHQIDELLDPDLRKIGASGRLWTRAQMVPALVGELI